MINADEVLKVVDALDDLKKKALAQVGEQDAEIERVNFTDIGRWLRASCY